MFCELPGCQAFLNAAQPAAAWYLMQTEWEDTLPCNQTMPENELSNVLLSCMACAAAKAAAHIDSYLDEEEDAGKDVADEEEDDLSCSHNAEVAILWWVGSDLRTTNRARRPYSRHVLPLHITCT